MSDTKLCPHGVPGWQRCGVCAPQRSDVDAKACPWPASQRSQLREQVLAELRSMASRRGDPEVDHGRADQLLLDLINDDEITSAFEAIEKWYA